MRIRLALASAALLLAAPASAQQGSCPVPAGWQKAEGPGITVAYRPDPAMVAHQFFAIDFRLCGPQPSDGVPRVDATMPRHGHGVNYRPTVVRTQPGVWRAEGLMLHMTGQWRLTFEVPGADPVLRASVELDVER